MSNFIEVKANVLSIGKRKLISGHGINDADYQVQPRINGKKSMCPYYQKWASMIERCYSDKIKAKYPTYIGATVCKEWLTFSVFKEWMGRQEWEGKELDKDIIKPGNKHYSPYTCCFVPKLLNSLLCDSRAVRGDLPQGVCLDKERGKYLAQCSYKGKRNALGRYKTVNAASLRYRLFKSQLIRATAEEQEDERVKAGLIKHAKIILYNGETV